MQPKSIDQIFWDAGQIPPGDDRNAYLERACAGDAELRRRVEHLLEARSQAENFLDRPAAGQLGTADETPVNERPGTIIGPYKLLEQIGEGGFGVVFMAEQTRPLSRRVALKVLKAGMDTRQVVARFEAERQALAIMDHANIAKVFDGGTTSSGRPYFVMELVKGVQITEFCDQNRLTPRQRLELFVPVCQAVQHAHQKGIIHRDLKPSNVLVSRHDATPVVKVIDFGVAKALGQKLTEKTLFTGIAQMIGTPLYMSPEQAGMSDLDVDTRSDIYSLGVLLYELLTATTPFTKERFKEAGYDEIRRIVREEEPPKPSTRLSESKDSLASISAQRQTEPALLTKLVRGELDWIVMKALEKDRNRRYETASALAADVQRYLNDEAVQACPPSTWYRCRKFARRNRGALVLASVLTVALVLLMAAVAGSIGWAVSDRAARDVALDGEVSRILDEAERLGKEENWSEALAAIERAEKLLAAGGRQERPERLLQLQPDFSMAVRLEEIFTHPKEEEFGNPQALHAEYARAFRDFGIDLAVLPAADAVQRIRARSIRLELARALDVWSGVRKRAKNAGPPDLKQLLDLAREADPDPWRCDLRDALERNDAKALAALAASVDVRKLPPGPLHLLAGELSEAGQRDRAVALLRLAQRQYPENLWINHQLAWLCRSALKPPQYDDTLRFLAAALAVRPKNPYIACAIGITLIMRNDGAGLGLTHGAKTGRRSWPKPVADSYVADSYTDAVAMLSRAIELKPDYALAWYNRGVAYWGLGQLDKTIADFSQSLDLGLADANRWHKRAEVYLELGQPDKAVADLDKAVAVDPDFNVAWHNLCGLHVAMGQLQQAVAKYARAADKFPADLELQCEYASVLLLAGNQEDYRRVRGDVLHRFAKAKDLETFYMVARIVSLAPGTADRAQAVELAEKAAAARPRAWYLHALAVAHYRAEQFDQAVRRAEQSLKDDPSWPAHVADWLVLAMAHHRLGHPADVRVWLDRSRKWMERERDKFPKGAPVIWPVPSWSDRLEIELLRREAEALFEAGQAEEKAKDQK